MDNKMQSLVEKEGWEKEISQHSYDRFADGSRYRGPRRVDLDQAVAILRWIAIDKKPSPQG